MKENETYHRGLPVMTLFGPHIVISYHGRQGVGWGGVERGGEKEMKLVKIYFE